MSILTTKSLSDCLTAFGTSFLTAESDGAVSDSFF